jgi:hypothetical protein
MPKPPDQRPASPNATTSRDRPHGSTRNCAVERRAPGIHRPDRDGLLTLLAGRTASLAVQEADIPCTSLLTSDHRKRNLLGQRHRPASVRPRSVSAWPVRRCVPVTGPYPDTHWLLDRCRSNYLLRRVRCRPRWIRPHRSACLGPSPGLRPEPRPSSEISRWRDGRDLLGRAPGRLHGNLRPRQGPGRFAVAFGEP